MRAAGLRLVREAERHRRGGPELGIAPLLERTICEQIVAINRDLKMTILLIAQNANLALEVSHYGYVLETGRILLHDTAAALRANPKVREAYLGG